MAKPRNSPRQLLFEFMHDMFGVPREPKISPLRPDGFYYAPDQNYVYSTNATTGPVYVFGGTQTVTGTLTGFRWAEPAGTLVWTDNAANG